MRSFLNLFKKTIKSLSRKEEFICLILIITILISSFFAVKNYFIKNFLPPVNEKNISDKSAIYSEGLVGQIKRLNPLFVDLNSIDRDISYLIFSGLSRYNPSAKIFEEDLATHSLSSDKKTYTFTVKPNIKWHDGEKVTADDVYFTFHDLIQNPKFTENPVIKANFEGIEIKQINQYVVSFTLPAPNSFFFSNLTVGILPKHILKNVPIEKINSDKFNKFPIGTGAYQLIEPIQKIDENSDQVNLRLFKDYYSSNPTIKKIRLTSFPDQESMLKAKNSLHGLSKITNLDYLQNLREDDRFNIYKYTLPQYTALFLNSDSKFLKNRNVRLAVSKSINKNELIKNVSNKTSIDTVLLELDQNNWLHQSNIEEAKGALYDAYWRYPNESADLRRNLKNEKFTLKLLYQKYEDPLADQEINKITGYLKEKLAKIGCEIILESYKNTELQEKILKRSYDLLLYGQNLGYNLDTYAYWHSSQAEKGLNLSNYRSPTADNLIEKIRNTFDYKDKIKRLNYLGETIQEDIPVIVLYTPNYYFAADKTIENIDLSNLSFPADRYGSLAQWDFILNK